MTGRNWSTFTFGRDAKAGKIITSANRIAPVNHHLSKMGKHRFITANQVGSPGDTTVTHFCQYSGLHNAVMARVCFTKKETAYFDSNILINA